MHEREGGLGLIAAVARNGVIGREGALPWRLPADLRHFKRTTLGHCLILGRRTWESLPGPLPGRTTIVVTRNRDYAAEGTRIAHSFERALELAREAGDVGPIAGGGAEIYAAALPLARTVWLTRVHADVPGDAWFPGWERRGWTLREAIDHPADDRHAHPFTIETWERT